MAFDFSELKKSRGTTKELLDQMNKFSGQKDNSKDERFWYPNVDKAGNGYAVIRFLPAPAGEDTPFIRLFSHSFQGPTGTWYIENSLTTLNKTDPVGELNNQLWNSGLESDKEIARKQKRKLTFISNIFVVEDTMNPENNGKVFLFKYGKKIWDKINDSMNPQYPDDAAVNPFDLWEGANFKLKIRNVEGYRNYDKSEFTEAAPLFKNDEKLEAVWKAEYSLQEFVDPSNFKSYEELKERLNKVIGATTVIKRNVAEKTSSSYDDDEDEINETPAPTFKSKAAPAPKMDDDDDEDEGLDFFKKLAAR